MKRYIIIVLALSLIGAACGSSNYERLEETPEPDPTPVVILTDAEIEMLAYVNDTMAPAMGNEIKAIKACLDDYTDAKLDAIISYHVELVDAWNASNGGTLVGGNVLGLEQLVERTGNDIRGTLSCMIAIRQGGGDEDVAKGVETYQNAISDYQMLITEIERLKGLLAGGEDTV
jgi:hypothetical protein